MPCLPISEYYKISFLDKTSVILDKQKLSGSSTFSPKNQLRLLVSFILDVKYDVKKRQKYTNLWFHVPIRGASPMIQLR